MPLLFLLILVLTCYAAEWPQWRGPLRDGSSAAFTAPAAWPKSLTRKWRIEVGGGYSSPVVSGESILVFTRQGGDEVAAALDLKTGRALWRSAYPAPFRKNQYAQSMQDGPFSTPLIADGRLYTLGVNGVLSCFDAKTGRLNWRNTLGGPVDTSRMFTGTAMSPLMEAGRLIVHSGDDGGGALVAIDARSGKELWRWQGDGPGYASPIVVALDGVRQVVTLTNKSAVGIDAASGKLLWTFPFKDQWNENIVTPVAHGENLILSGVRNGTTAITATRAGGAWAAKQVWHNAEIAMYMSSPVLDGDRLYGLSAKKKGQFFCLDARTGAVQWISRGRDAQSASVIQAGGFLLWTTTDGEIVVTRKSAGSFEPVARYQVADSPVWSHAVVLGREILIKDASALTMYALQ